MKPFARFALTALLCLSTSAFTLPASAEEGAAATPAPAAAPAADRRQGNNVTWHGSVDGAVNISIRHRTVQITVLSGRSLRRHQQQHRFQGFLPARDTTVRLENAEGPGTIEVTQQPSAANNFTAIVHIVNEQASRDEFRFTLVW